MSALVRASDLIEKVIEGFGLAREIAPFEDAIRDAASWSARLKAIRDYYREHERLHGSDYTGTDPYQSGLWNYLTPIELLLWQDVRMGWQTPVVMQYPVGPYFLDFACPSFRVGIEADGKAFHEEVRDRKRDEALWYEHGWKVYRVTGAECYRTFLSPEEFISDHYDDWQCAPYEHEIERMAAGFFGRTSTGVVRAIGALEFQETDAGDFRSQMRAALVSHRLASFPVGA